MNKKKVLILITKSVLGGAQKYVAMLAVGLPKELYQITVAAAPGGWLEDFLMVQKIKFIPIYSFLNKGKKQDIIDAFFDYKAFCEVYNILQDDLFDILHTNSTKAGFIGRIVGKVSKVPIVIHTTHGLNLNEDLVWYKWVIICFAEKIAGFFTDKLIAVSKNDRKSVESYNLVNSKKITVVYNGVNCHDNSNSSRLFGLKQLEKTTELYGNNKIVGTIANYSHNKGLEYFIEAAEIIVKEFPFLKFFIVGDCDNLLFLDKINRSSAKENIILWGIQQDIGNFLSNFDIFVMPSIKEGAPFALIEAMAYSLPIVATNVGGMPEIIENGISGLIVPPKDPQKLVFAIIKLLSNKEYSKMLAVNAKIRQRNFFSDKKMIKATIDIYNE